ncbi:MAG TPA: molybdopterin biosynthesis protein [Gemmataceae bacterium]|jgi:putative molybdopterin biosynthesis protein|nr:molybdopterin biosynthesis protein [Gemmataceae bacterium]
MQQDQFLNVIDRDEAERRFHAALDLSPLAAEEIPLQQAFQRVLARDVVAPIDVPGFDRANVDGFALRSEDTFGAREEEPRKLRLESRVLATGMVPRDAVTTGTAMAMATGAMVPRGADAVVMVEHTDTAGQTLMVRRPVTPGANITFAGTDIGRGETVLWAGDLLTARETGVLAALGIATVPVVRRPRVGILSTGDEIIPPGATMRPGLVYDSNAAVLADAVRELGGEPVALGIVGDNAELLERALRQGLAYDLVLLSGGTSKGPGDLSYRVVASLGPPGILVHGVALKPGKPLCLAAITVKEERGKPRTVPVVILPGFPTSAIFTFHEFVAPVLRCKAGRITRPSGSLQARLAMRVNSERGRTEYLLVSLVAAAPGEPTRATSDSPQATDHIAYPMGKGSGSVTAFSRADGFIIIPRQREYLEAGESATVHLLSQAIEPVDLVVIGSHCVGLDYLLGRLRQAGFRSKFLAVGSTAGLEAARRGECDLAGIHLLHPETNTYNLPYVNDDLILVQGYGRLQGILYRAADARFAGHSAAEAVRRATDDPACMMINRNRGSGTRVLIDRLLAGRKPAGYLAEARSHNAVAAAVAQARADWGVAIANVAGDQGLGFLPLQDERYDFVIPRARQNRPAVHAFLDLLAQAATREALAEMGFRISAHA